MIPLNLTEVLRTCYKRLALGGQANEVQEKEINENDNSRVNNGNSATVRTGSFHTDELYLCIG